MFLFIDNYDSFSYNIVQYFQQLGEKPTVITNDNPILLELAQHPELEKVVISPGPSSPENAGYCLEFLALLPKQIPVLGICLGHQCLGHFAGCPVVRGPKVMHGKTSCIEHNGRGLYKGIPSPLTIGRYHSLVVKCNENHPLIDVTARDEDGEVQSMRYKDRPWVGVQYHPESILTKNGLELLANFPKSIINNDQNAISINPIIEQLANRKDLHNDAAEQAFSALMDGKLTAAQAGAFLLALRMKGETTIELSAAARCALERAVLVEGIKGNTIDIVGTGGDGKKSFNCSTATALIIAALGYQVVKHGNRAVSSSSGAGDVLEHIGYPIPTNAKGVKESLSKYGFAFEFAPYFHPCFKNISPVRAELGVRTLFNMLGPLINPSRPTYLMLGVARPEMVRKMADVIAQGNYKRALVICGAGDYDELTAFGPATICLVENGQVRDMRFNPADYGFNAPTSEQELVVNSKEEAAEIFAKVLKGTAPQAMLDMVTLNTAMAIYLMEKSMDMQSCINKARTAIETGIGARLLSHWKKEN